MMAFAGFAKEHSLDAAAGTQSLFNKPRTFNADESVFRGEAAAQSHAELLEPAIIAASEQRGIPSGASVTSGFSWRGHHRGA